MAKPRSARPAPARLARPAAPASYPRALVASQLARVRALCRQLPDVTEQPSHGSQTFFVGKRVFAYFLDNHHGDGRLALWCAAPDGAQAMLVDSDPDRYFLPPYVAHRGWIGVRLDRDLPWNQIAMVLEAAHQMHHRPPRAVKPARAARADALLKLAQQGEADIAAGRVVSRAEYKKRLGAPIKARRDGRR